MQTLLISVEHPLLHLLRLLLYALGVGNGSFLPALCLAQASGQFVDALLDTLAVLVEFVLGLFRLVVSLLYIGGLVLLLYFWRLAIFTHVNVYRLFAFTQFKFQLLLLIHGSSLHVQNIFRAVYNPNDFVVVENSDFSAINLDARTCVSTENNPVTFLAPGSIGEL